MEYRTIKRAILFCMIFVPLIPFLLSIGIGYYYFATSLENSVTSSMKRIVLDHRRMIESFFKERKSDLELVAGSYSLDQLSRQEKLEHVFLNLRKSSSAFADLGVFNEDGIHLAYRGPYPLTGKVYKKAEWFQNVMQKGSFISDIFLGYRQIPHFVIAVASNNKHPKWVIRASIDTQVFDTLVEEVRIGKTGEAYIVNSEGILQTNRRSGGKLMEVLDEIIRFPSNEGEIQTFISNDPTGKAFFHATTWLGGKKWLLVVRQSKSDAFQSLRYATFLILGVSVLGGFFIIGVAFYTTNRIVKRMKKTDAEKNQLGKQLIGASRLAELGEMAAGFAHEINNPLQIIKNEESLIQITISELKDAGSLKPSSELEDIEDSLNQIQLQLSRCSKITQSILKFSRQNEPVLSNIDIHKIISEVSGMIDKKADVNGIVLRYDISPNTPTVYGDASQLQQVLLNLYNNAMDAIIEKHGPSGGELGIKANQNNGWVEISISDNGIGIEQKNLDKIFTPFFTTKSVGKGTGLGLSVCYGIINGLGGKINVQSRKGAGTNFLIKLPAAAIEPTGGEI
ncbi:MAG: two-component sensor histidine kinase [Deltaproteobacteria bacterium]|nr:two-component sensor histidine kinase [Deltaproteobacteria bacterium]